MKIKKNGEKGSALSLVLIFVTVSGLAISSLIFVTQISTTGVHQLSQGNKETSAIAEATADILARFQKDPTLGTSVFPAASENCGLGQGFALNPSSGVTFVSCIPVTGGAPFATTTIATTVPGGTVGVDYGTAFDGNFNFNNAINSASTIAKAASSTVNAPNAQEFLTSNSSGSSSGTTPSAVTTASNNKSEPVSACAVYADDCKLDISYWVASPATPKLPVMNCKTTDFTIPLTPGIYVADDITALQRFTKPADSSKYKGWLFKSGKYEDGTECANKGQKITITFEDGEYILTGNTTFTINNSNVTLRNTNSKVIMCTSGYKPAKCSDGITSGWNGSTDKNQYSCDYNAVDSSSWTGPLSGTTTNSQFRGSRIFLDAVDLNVLKGSIYLCGTNFLETKVLNNFPIIALDSQRVSSCKSKEKVASRCPSTPARSTYINFANTAEVHIGGGYFTPNASVSISESRNKQHTWDREWISKSLKMTCSVVSGCEHSVLRGGDGRRMKVTLKTIEGAFISREINMNDYDPKNVIKRIDN